MFSTSSLFVSLLWSSVGMGYLIFGKKQRSWPPMAGGVFMIAGSYFCDSVLLMSLVSIGIMLGVYLLLKAGH